MKKKNELGHKQIICRHTKIIIDQYDTLNHLFPRDQKDIFALVCFCWYDQSKIYNKYYESIPPPKKFEARQGQTFLTNRTMAK